MSMVNNNSVKATNLDKIFWPKEKYTKGDVIEYYRKIAPYILPYLKDRPESLLRQPNGIGKPGFFQKNIEHKVPERVVTHKIYSESNEENINYLVCQNKETLIYMANLGCIEINPWFSRIQHLDHPDYCVLDLDPEKISFEKVIEAALTIHKFLDKLDIPNYCKPSGATGLHIYIPLGAKYGYNQAKTFAELVAKIINKQIPEFTSVLRMPAKRQGKVYLD